MFFKTLPYFLELNLEKRPEKYSPEEFSDIFKRYWGKVYAICMRYTHDADLSKDMVQNIFITLWERELPLRDEQSIGKYLSGAAKFQIFKNLRDNRTGLLKKLDTAEDDISDIAANIPDQQYVYRELNAKLEQQIASLNEPARTIFKLSLYDALSHKEIAHRMGIAVKTVEYHLTKAKKLLRSKTC